MSGWPEGNEGTTRRVGDYQKGKETAAKKARVGLTGRRARAGDDRKRDRPEEGNTGSAAILNRKSVSPPPWMDGTIRHLGLTGAGKGYHDYGIVPKSSSYTLYSPYDIADMTPTL